MTELDLTASQSPLNRGRLLLIARRQWWVVVVFALFGAVGAAGYTQLQAKRYAASVLVLTGIEPTTPTTTAATPDSIFPNPDEELQVPSVIDAAASPAHIAPSQVDISGDVTANESQIVITATEPTPAEASLAAAGAAKAFTVAWASDLRALAAAAVPQLNTLEGQLLALEKQAGAANTGGNFTSTTIPGPLADAISVVNTNYNILYDEQLEYKLAAQYVQLGQTGNPAPVSVSDSRKKLVLLGLGIGALAGCGAALLRDLARRRLTDPSEVPELDLVPRIGALPSAHMGRNQTVVDVFSGRLGEAARQLYAGLITSPHTRPFKSVMVTSAGTSEGKSFVAANLALASASSGARTVLVCSDMRRPGLERAFGHKTSFSGLASWLQGANQVQGHRQSGNGSHSPQPGDGHFDNLLVPTSVPGLSIIAAGPVGANPNDLLSSPAMRDLVNGLEAEADMVIFDSPPLLAVADPLVLSQYVDATLFVVCSGQSTKPEVSQALELLERSRCHTVGYVLNRTQHTGLPSYSYPVLERPQQVVASGEHENTPVGQSASGK